MSGSYPPYEDSGVIIFSKRGVVQRAVHLEPIRSAGDRGSYGRTVLVGLPHPNARSLEFIDISPIRVPRLR